MNIEKVFKSAIGIIITVIVLGIGGTCFSIWVVVQILKHMGVIA